MQLVLLDTAAIQRYIFGSNRLRENVGASYLVSQATREWAFDCLPKPHNVVDYDFDNEVRIETADDVKAEVIYAGGGNAVILFRDERDAGQFLRDFSKKILIDAPGLTLVATSLPFQWDDEEAGALYSAVQKGLTELNSKKRQLAESEPLLGLGVTQACQSTGLPAVAYSPKVSDTEEPFPVCREVFEKQQARDSANARLRLLLDPGDDFSYPDELDGLGRSVGEFSYIAVVHIDGNAMGQRIRSIGNELRNRKYILAIRSFSTALNDAGLAALKSAITLMRGAVNTKSAAIIDPQSPDARGRRIELQSSDRRIVLPFRPILYGGDDVTFVCDGRIAVPLALHYMRAFREATQNLPDEAGSSQSCAGIAIVKSHYPFARACDLANQLCGSAKAYVRELNESASALDWHFANAGLAGDLHDIRGRELETRDGLLNLRPLISSQEDRFRSWRTIQSGIDAFCGTSWVNRRNKVKALRDALRSGPSETKTFCEKYLVSDDQKLPNLRDDPNLPDYRSDGWLQVPGELGKRCAYFDAVELADFLITLDPAQSQPDGPLQEEAHA